MSKRPKKARGAAAETPGAKKARPGKSGATKGSAEEPFFRPFTKLKLPKKVDAANGEGIAKGDPKSDPKAVAKAAAPPPKKAAPVSTVSQLVDRETFALYMAGVRALDDHHANRIPRTASQVERAPADLRSKDDLDAPARAQMRSLVSEGLRFESSDDGQRLEGRRVDVDPRELRRLRRGEHAIDGTLDLHGMSLTEAREAVTTFVRKRGSEGDRVVAIIHGKGSHSPRGVAVLRGEIGAWLSDGRAARHVMAFATAPDDHGGTGALLVLLAR
jgi:DNA-nicking Smr family endonuclease